jgi:predicted unusual protein kinase regulating ubiquinone biosynthesis (AarF/ABC1/UbiB family)
MLQVATFAVPAEQDKANEFLKTHKPFGNINFNKDTLIVFYDNGEVSPEYQIADIKELLESVQSAKFQQEVSLHILKAEIADLNRTHNKGRFEELDNAIRAVQAAISNQELKESFLTARIKELRQQPANG